MTDYERIAKVIAYLKQRHVEQPSLADLARVADLSESHFHRLFTRWARTTPKDFLKYLTVNHAKSMLQTSRDLLSVSLDAGLSGPGRLHDLFVSVEAMSPGEFKRQGHGVEIRWSIQESPFGPCLIAVTDRGLCHLAFLDSELNPQQALEGLKKKWPQAQVVEKVKETAQTAKMIFEGQGEKLSILLGGTAFQLKVWEALLRIPSGHLASYSDIAKAIGTPGASRAVGTAIGQNSIAYLIPCHRVIRETGEFGAYRWGGERKCALLAWESALKSSR